MTNLIQCKDCDKKISRKAKACPHCGRPRRNYFSIFIIVAALLFLVFHEEIHDQFGIPNPVDFVLHRLLGAFRD